jgi:hypothetical protein
MFEIDYILTNSFPNDPLDLNKINIARVRQHPLSRHRHVLSPLNKDLQKLLDSEKRKTIAKRITHNSALHPSRILISTQKFKD